MIDFEQLRENLRTGSVYTRGGGQTLDMITEAVGLWDFIDGDAIVYLHFGTRRAMKYGMGLFMAVADQMGIWALRREDTIKLHQVRYIFGSGSFDRMNQTGRRFTAEFFDHWRPECPIS